MLHWVPDEGLRSVGHPRLCWIDPIQSFVSGLAGNDDFADAWYYLLANRQEAKKQLEDFVSYSVNP